MVAQSPHKILIIDDDEDDYLIAREMLRAAQGRKYDVRWAATYQEGQQELLSDPYDAVLVDYDLGRRSGIELIREANERGYPAPLILFTGRGGYEVDVEAMEAGASLYLTKDEANPLLLERLIRYAIERKLAEAELRAGDALLRETNEALRLSEERFYRAFNANPSAQVISRVEDGRIEAINDSFARLFGYSREEALGKTSLDLGMFANPADREEATRRLKADQFLRDFELDIRTRTGEIRRASLSVEQMDTGEKPSMLTIIQDISGRKQAEAELRANAEALERSMERERARAAEMETLMDTVPALIWIARDREAKDMTGNRYGSEFLKMWQGANISKSAPDAEQALQPYRNFKDGREIPPDELPMQVAAATGKPASNYDFDLVFNDGTVRTVLGNVNPLFDEQGRPCGAVAAFMDITDRRQEQEQLKHYARELERSNRALQDFAFVASHDLQEPLRKIILFGDRLKERVKGAGNETSTEPGSTLDYLQRMQNAAARMQAMVDGLLELSRVNTRGRPFAPVDLNQVAAEVVNVLESRIRAAGGRVQVENLPQIEADEVQMHQLLQNLIGNALKFHRAGVAPVVRVSGKVTAGKNPQAEIRVEDNGIGFDPAYAERIFQPFQRLHGRSEYEGTGLGLAICQKIVERHGGTIEVESAPGSGAKFTIRVPVKQKERV